ncbi:MAG: branched-chain amino acid ABC transporter permease, partial [Acidimicrobiales bacterium]
MRGLGFLQIPGDRGSLLALGAGSRGGAETSRAALTRLVQAVVLAAVVLSPWLHVPRLSTSLLTLICIYGIAATGLNLMFGYGGMLSLGNGVFLGLSAYGAAILSQKMHWAMVPSMLVGIAVGTAVAAVLGLLLVRLSAHYFGVATLGLAIAFYALPDALPNLTGGGSGITAKPQMSLGFVTVQSKLQWYVVALVVTAAAVLLLAWVVAGKRGRILRLVRHDQLAAEVLGVPVLRVKLLAFVVGSALAALAGA